MKIEHVALFCRDLEAMRQFFLDYFEAVSNEQYHNPRTGLRTYILSFPNGGARLELMKQREQSEACFDSAESRQKSTEGQLKQREQSEACFDSAESRQKSTEGQLKQRPDTIDADPSKSHIGFIHVSFAVGSKEAVDAKTVELRDAGYQVVSGPRTTGDGYYESCILGPEGIQIEITI